MYLVNTEIAINYLLPAAVSFPDRTEYDVVVRRPDGTNTFYPQAIDADKYMDPTDVTNGYASFPFTPDEVGVWGIILVTGEASPHNIFYEYFLRVSINDTHVEQQVVI